MADEKVASWSYYRGESTLEKLEGIEHVDPTSDYDIVGGVVLSNPIVFGVPDRSEIFRLAILTDESADVLTNPISSAGQWLRVVNPEQLQLFDFVAPASVDHEAASVVDNAVDLRMRATSCDIALCRIRVLESKVTDEGREMVFEGTEATRPATYRKMRVLHVSVHANGLATHEVISETPYPG